MKLRKIALGTVAIAAVIALFATGPEVGQVWSQVANAQDHEINPYIHNFPEDHGLLPELELHPSPEIHPPPPEIEPHH
jgi:hypothetical protein